MDDMISRLRIVHRLAILTISMALFLVGVAAVGIFGMSSILAGLRTVYEDRTVCLVQLDTIHRDLNRIRWSVREAVEAPLQASSLVPRLDRDEAEIDAQWSAYMATYLAPDEKLIAGRIAVGLSGYRAVRKRILALVQAGQADQANALFRGESAPILADLLAAIDEDIALQDRIGKQEYEKGTRIAAAGKSWAAGAAALALVLGGLLSGYIVRSIVRPLRMTIGAMRRLTDGDLSVEIGGLDRRDEMGDIARALSIFRDGARQMERMHQAQDEQKRQAEEARQAGMRQMADALEAQVGAIVGRVTAASLEMRSSSVRMAASAEQTSARASGVAGSASQASDNVRTVAAATDELTASIREIAKHVDQSKTVIGRADDEARLSAALMRTLSEDAARITEILSLIGDIADQTNLLALNATIEAARAGQAGKGFAVVAAEVKALSRQASQATGQIAERIAAVQAGSNQAVQAINSIALVTGELSEIGSFLARSVARQTRATADIGDNVGQAATRTDQAARDIGEVEAAAHDTGAAAAQISAISSDLAAQAGSLEKAVAGFLHEVRGP